jgi:hydrogenase large subunit
LRFFLTLADDLGLDRLGAGPDLYLSYGAYPQPDGAHAFRGGVWDAQRKQADALDLDAITEDATHAWLDDAGGARHPFAGLTEPRADKPGAYTWNKAPRLNGAVLETGAIARQLADGHPLIADAVARCGGSVYTRAGAIAGAGPRRADDGAVGARSRPACRIARPSRCRTRAARSASTKPRAAVWAIGWR